MENGKRGKRAKKQDEERDELKIENGAALVERSVTIKNEERAKGRKGLISQCYQFSIG
jgi:hypothetical protein